MKLTNFIDYKAQLTTTSTPLLYFIIIDRTHDPASAWLYNYKSISLHSYPRCKLNIILNDYIRLEKVGIKALTF